MSTLSALRQSARALLPGECFLRRDQQLRALFVTDFPRRHAPEAGSVRLALQEGGFEVTEEKGLWLLDLGPSAQQRFIASLPAPVISRTLSPEIYSLCRSLLSRGATPPENQPWEAVRLTLLRLDAKEAHLLIPTLQALTAQYKRQKQPLPTVVVSLLLAQEDSSC